MEAVQEDIRYDSSNRMMYHPDFHFNHGNPFTVSELEYLCKYWEFDDRRTMSFSLGRPETILAATVYQLKKSGQFEHYKHLNTFW